MYLRALRSLAFGFLLAVAGSTAAWAVPGKLTGVTASPNPAPKNTAVSVTLTKTGAGCGFKIHFGDGPGVGPFVFTGGSKVLTHTYSQPGTYTIQAWGKAKGSKQACKGGTKVGQVTVINASPNPGGNGQIQKAPAKGVGNLKFKAPMKAQLTNLTTHAIVTPAKNHAKFNVTANRESTLKLRVFALIPPPNRRCDETLPPLKATFALGKKKQWSTKILGLAPSRKHYWEVCAKDSFGQTAMASGTFKTGDRRVEVSFDMIKITDDSDDLGDGELFFIFEAGGKKKNHDPGEQGTGDLFFTGKSITLDHPSSQLSIRIRGGDNDGDGFTSSPIKIPDVNHTDWGEIKKTLSLSNEASTTMYKWTASDHGLGFNAQVTVTVTLN
ncbi:MAG: PKD domain-containing protein [Deltaproteobacteria bacterium]|nr:PKD domain-containing protein [Deltaproteobacteria bacterium]